MEIDLSIQSVISDHCKCQQSFHTGGLGFTDTPAKYVTLRMSYKVYKYTLTIILIQLILAAT